MIRRDDGQEELRVVRAAPGRFPMKRRAPQSDLGLALRDDFARNVRHFRTLRGLTQHELAIAAGLSRTFISQIERGRFSVTLETIGALSAGLDVVPAELVRAAG